MVRIEKVDHLLIEKEGGKSQEKRQWLKGIIIKVRREKSRLGSGLLRKEDDIQNIPLEEDDIQRRAKSRIGSGSPKKTHHT